MKQTYNHAGVSIYHGDCRELELTEPADVMISDPPYSAQTHNGARTSKGGAKGGSVQVTFEPLTFGQLANTLTHLAVARGVDRLRCLGNVQVPAVARLAWETLTSEMGEG